MRSRRSRSPAVAASAAASSARRAAIELGDAPRWSRRRACPPTGRSAGSSDLIAVLSSETAEPRPAYCARPRRARRRCRRRAIAAAASVEVALGQQLMRAPARCLADSKQRTVPAIATLSDSAGAGHRDGARDRRGGRRPRRRGRAPRCRATTAVGRRKSTSVYGVAGGGGGTQPLPTELAQRVERLHRRPPFRDRVHHRDPEDRTGRGPHDLGIVRVDRSGPEDDCRRARRLRAAQRACRGCRDRRARRPRRPGRRAASTSRPASGDRRDREHRLRRARGADLLQHAFLQHRAPAPRGRDPGASARGTRRRRGARSRPPRSARRGRARRRPHGALRPRTPARRRAPAGRAGARAAA